MKASLHIDKGLRLADAGRVPEAIEALLTALQNAEQDNDDLSSLRASCIVGLLYEQHGDLALAAAHLRQALSTKIGADYDDVVAFELDQARQALIRLNAEQA